MTDTTSGSAPDFYRIAAYGDSTQYGDGAGQPYNVSAMLERLLRAVYYPDFVVENHGVPKIDTANRVNGWVLPEGRAACPWAAEMAGTASGECPASFGGCGTTAAWIINNTLINDVVVSNGATSPDQYAEYYSTMARLAADNDRRFVIEMPNPITGLDDTSLTQFFAYADRQRYVARAKDLPLIEQTRLLNEFVPEWPQLTPDGLHPDHQLLVAKALIVFWTMYPLMKNGALPPWGPPRDIFRTTWQQWWKQEITDAQAGAALVRCLPSSLQ